MYSLLDEIVSLLTPIAAGEQFPQTPNHLLLSQLVKRVTLQTVLVRFSVRVQNRYVQSSDKRFAPLSDNMMHRVGAIEVSQKPVSNALLVFIQNWHQILATTGCLASLHNLIARPSDLSADQSACAIGIAIVIFWAGFSSNNSGWRPSGTAHI